MSISCRLIIEDRSRSGAENMAVDEALLEEVNDLNRATVRIYGWEEATLSLGYFQHSSELTLTPELQSLPKVRRLSGGGAILHHRELTYSCVLPRQHPCAEHPRRLYAPIHNTVIELLSRYGYAISMHGTESPTEGLPLLCFFRRDAQDLTYQGHKILGSAQRRRRGAILQHGSLLLQRSEFAPDFPGLRDFANSLPENDVLRSELGEALAAAISQEVVPGELTSLERERAAKLWERKYQFLDWSDEQKHDFGD